MKSCRLQEYPLSSRSSAGLASYGYQDLKDVGERYEELQSSHKVLGRRWYSLLKQGTTLFPSGNYIFEIPSGGSHKMKGNMARLGVHHGIGGAKFPDNGFREQSFP